MSSQDHFHGITNTQKIKKMNRKQLRSLIKGDLSVVGKKAAARGEAIDREKRIADKKKSK
ncbi:hypothetical protein H696_00175 [Fonticula alba]|uniref:Uncharacterized protein n=1 Tax=Fonticula alba TaxID=691883 RepID=A0A058ZDZ3_FONAL|nr:hypothetical protein H696_00175 [Fonticula alba]KCV72584.1 hypothetical protein H696_00175 [Fonticula alba]|eukprot:XP_009492285.1 hypothetical protein H696_00175 [Fonticula alba]